MLDILLNVEIEIRQTIKSAQNTRQLFRHESGRQLMLSEVMEHGVSDGPIIGALAIFYAPGYFMTLDRIVAKQKGFKKQRRIIYYLDSRPGQIGSTILLELLKLQDGERFSKAEFVQKIDQSYFENFTVSSGEINEALSRMFRKTMKQFFGINGRFFARKPFSVYFRKIKIPPHGFDKNAYEFQKMEIDYQVNQFIKQLNKTFAKG